MTVACGSTEGAANSSLAISVSSCAKECAGGGAARIQSVGAMCSSRDKAVTANISARQYLGYCAGSSGAEGDDAAVALAPAAGMAQAGYVKVRAS